ncbi:MAG: hypothetical protein GQ583_12390 [Methyloprofundus sp.]|nr:hypothetical protein [Methyloprofundus sp.]
MGVLEQLRKEADQKKSSEQLQLDQKQQRERVYKIQLLPKMQELFKYLQELVEHLNYLEVPVQVENYSLRFPKLGTLAQKDYKISTDGYGGFSDIDKLMQINVTFYCIGEGEFKYVMTGKGTIEKEIAYLHAKRLSVRIQKMPGLNNEETAKFFVKRLIPVRLRFEVDYDNSLIKVIINNYTNFSTYIESWQANDINEDFLDVLARYLLRKDSEFIKPEISDEHREALRRKLAAIKKTETYW